jgi:hypothetical protein
MIWLFLLLLLFCAPAVFLAAVGLLFGAATLAMGFIVIWAALFILLAVVGVEIGMALLAAFGLAIPIGWFILGHWDPEVNS